MYARWVPDSRQVITISDFQLRLTIWSLVDESVSYIKNPKHHDKGISFTSNGKFMALAERNNCKDFIGIYYCGDWKLMNHFEVDTADLADLMWAKDDTAIVVWDNPIECRLLIYSATQGLLAQHIPYEHALGFRTVNFSPSGQFLAAGSYDQKVRLYNHISWKEITEFTHKKNLSDDEDVHIYTEEEYKQGGQYNFEEEVTSRYKMLDLPVKLTSAKQTSTKDGSPAGVHGVSLISWSYDGKYIATKNDNTPN
jgi:WD40 repeat protein